MGNADGFAPKLTVGTGNYFYGCRSWQNSDDAYDCLLGSDLNVTTTFENCWAFKAGYLPDGTQGQGNGNGFKMGSANYRHNIILKNCLAFQNLAKGFDQNHNKGDMNLSNCTAYSNGGNNYSIYDPLASGKTATLTNCVNFPVSNNLGAFVVLTKVSWQPPFVTNSADFNSLDPSAATGPRNADGSLPKITFMHLAAGSDLIDGGNDVGLPYNGSAPDLGAFEYIPYECTSPIASDLDGDCQVDLFDYALLADAWADGLTDADLNNDGFLDLMDIAQFANDWLGCNREPQSECWQ